MATTCDTFLANVKRRMSVPSNQALLADTDILAFADTKIKSHLVPVLVSARQDYFVYVINQPLTNGIDTYSIPYRSLARGLREIKIRDNSNNIRNLNLIELEDAHLTVLNERPYGFYFKGDKIVLVPVPNNSDSSLDMWVDLPPGQCVSVSSCAIVQSVSAGVVTVSMIPSGMTNGILIDFIQGQSGNTILNMDKAIQNVSGNQITFNTTDIPQDALGNVILSAGDYITISNQSPVIQLPNECIPYLESLVCIEALTAVGDFDGANAMRQDASEELTNLKQILEPRDQGERKHILNRRGLLRGRWNYFRRAVYY